MNLPRFALDTTVLPRSERFAAWREFLGVLLDLEAPGGPPPANQRSVAENCLVGPMMLSRVETHDHRAHRTLPRIRRDQIDHVMVELHVRGAWRGEAAGRPYRFRPGTLTVFDLAQPLEMRASRSETLSLVLPRDLMEDWLPDFELLHGQCLSGGLAVLLGEHLKALWDSLPALQPGDSPQVTTATLQMVSACLQPSAARCERAGESLDAALLRRARGLIRDHLGERGLSPDWLCGSLGVSRARLYRLFGPDGGVMHYIFERRLLRACRMLQDRDESRPIGRIAEECGFGSLAHFSSAFRRRFGCSPSQARRGDGPMPVRARGVAGKRLRTWLQSLATEES